MEKVKGTDFIAIQADQGNCFAVKGPRVPAELPELWSCAVVGCIRLPGPHV